MPKMLVSSRPKFWFAAAFVSLFVLLLFAYSAQTSAENDAVPAVVCDTENLDPVAAPQIPAGWTTSATGAGANFVTVTNFAHSAPNAVFAPSASMTGLSELISPAILVTGTRTVLNFRQKYSLENT